MLTQQKNNINKIVSDILFIEDHSAIDWKILITLLFSIAALCVSMRTIYLTKKNLKKQIRVNKLEEILEVLHFLKGYYITLYKIFNRLDQAKTESLQDKYNIEKIEETSKFRNAYIDVVKNEAIQLKISRLKILSNAYLPNSKKNDGVKVKIHTIADLYYNMYVYVFTSGEIHIKKKSDAIIPIPVNFEKFTTKIINEIIIEMNLNYKSIESDSVEKYFQTQFKKDLEQ